MYPKTRMIYAKPDIAPHIGMLNFLSKVTKYSDNRKSSISMNNADTANGMTRRDVSNNNAFCSCIFTWAMVTKMKMPTIAVIST